jgi:hypothetical protein
VQLLGGVGGLALRDLDPGRQEDHLVGLGLVPGGRLEEGPGFVWFPLVQEHLG